MLSHVQFFVTSGTVAHQAPLSMGFPRQEHWSGLPLPSPGDLPHLGVESTSPALAGEFFTTESSGNPPERVGKWSRSVLSDSLRPHGAYQAPPSMGFSRQKCWSGLPFPSPGDLPDPGIEPRCSILQADALLFEPPGKPPQKSRDRSKSYLPPDKGMPFRSGFWWGGLAQCISWLSCVWTWCQWWLDSGDRLFQTLPFSRPETWAAWTLQASLLWSSRQPGVLGALCFQPSCHNWRRVSPAQPPALCASGGPPHPCPPASSLQRAAKGHLVKAP